MNRDARAMRTALLLMVASTICASALHAVVRDLTHVRELHPFVVAFHRNLFGALLLAPWLARRRAPPPSRRAFGLICVRSALNVAAMLAFFMALSLTPLATVSALSFTAPLFAAIGAVLVLGEVIHARRIAALVVGFIGMAIVLRPGFGGFDLGPLLAVGSAVLWAGALLVIKRLAVDVSSATSTAYAAAIMAVASLPPALIYWRWPTGEEFGLLLAMAVFGVSAQLFLAESFRRADASALMPLDFLKLIWASALGYALFVEVPDALTLIGGAVIFAGAVYIVYRESRLGGAARPPPQPPSH